MTSQRDCQHVQSMAANTTKDKIRVTVAPTCEATIQYDTASRPKDAFLFYSNKENLRKALNFETIDYKSEDSSAKTTVRKTRIAFERDLFSIMAHELWGDDMESDDDDNYDGNALSNLAQ